MFRTFEKIIDPYPSEAMAGPPKNTREFIGWFVKVSWPLLLAISTLGALLAFGEVMVFGFMGSLVNWLSTSTRANFFDKHGGQLALIGSLRQ